MSAAALLTMAIGIDPAEAQDCAASQTQAAMTICAIAGFQVADRGLNDTYKALMSRLQTADARSRLQAAQRAWLALRDAECDFSTGDSRGGSIHPMLVQQCRVADGAAHPAAEVISRLR